MAVAARTARPSIAAAVWLSVIGAAAFLIMPIIVGAAANLGLNEQQVGFLAFADLAGAALASVSAMLWVRRLDWRVAAAAGVVLLVLGNLGSIGIDQFGTLFVARLVTGLGEGTSYAIAVAWLGGTRDPDRAYGIMIAAQILTQVVGLAVLPSVVEVWGLDGIFVVLAAAGASGAACLASLPVGDGGWSWRGVRGTAPQAYMAVAAVLAFDINIGAIWTYLERIGSSAGISLRTIGVVLSVATVAGLGGALLAVLHSSRYGRVMPLTVAATAQIVAVAMLVNEPTVSTFVAAVTIYIVFWNYSAPFRMAVVAALDRTGQFMVILPAVQIVGITAGAALAALLVEHGLWMVSYLAVACGLVALALILPAAMKATERPGAQ